jgi:hypothetical protein
VKVFAIRIRETSAGPSYSEPVPRKDTFLAQDELRSDLSQALKGFETAIVNRKIIFSPDMSWAEARLGTKYQNSDSQGFSGGNFHIGFIAYGRQTA